MNTDLIDYNKCNDYARVLCGTYGIPACDVADVGSDAYLLSIRRAWRTHPGENEEAIAKRLMYTSVLNVINRRNKHSVRALSDAEELYRSDSAEGAPTDDEVIEERFAANDQTSTEDRLADYLDWQNPFWLLLFDSERQKLRNEKRKTAIRFLKFGLKDSRLSIVRSKMKFSWCDFQTILNFLKVRFALCFRALREYRRDH